jgi:hypothetical protein
VVQHLPVLVGQLQLRPAPGRHAEDRPSARPVEFQGQRTLRRDRQRRRALLVGPVEVEPNPSLANGEAGPHLPLGVAEDEPVGRDDLRPRLAGLPLHGLGRRGHGDRHAGQDEGRQGSQPPLAALAPDTSELGFEFGEAAGAAASSRQNARMQTE